MRELIASYMLAMLFVAALWCYFLANHNKKNRNENDKRGRNKLPNR